MKFKLPIAESIDRLAVDHIKQFKLNDFSGDFESEIKNIIVDIEEILKEKNLKLNTEIIRPIIILSQINLHIWNLKDEMQRDEKNYDNLLKLAHQLNGTRNQIKNLMLEIFEDKSNSHKRSNFETDGLQNWFVNVLKKK